MRKKSELVIASIITVLLAAIVLCAFYIAFSYMPQKRYEEAKNMIENNQPVNAARKLYNFDYLDSNGILAELCAQNASLSKMTLKVGDTLYFGRYQQYKKKGKEEAVLWKVLAVENGNILIQSVNSLDTAQYNSDASDRNVYDWTETSLYSWLNGAFFDEAFNEDESEIILSSDYGKVFILSEEETEKYGGAMCAVPTALATLHGAQVEDDGNTSVWLRGDTANGAAMKTVNAGSGWSVETIGNILHFDEMSGICPAIWLSPAMMTGEVVQ